MDKMRSTERGKQTIYANTLSVPSTKVIVICIVSHDTLWMWDNFNWFNASGFPLLSTSNSNVLLNAFMLNGTDVNQAMQSNQHKMKTSNLWTIFMYFFFIHSFWSKISIEGFRQSLCTCLLPWMLTTEKKIFLFQINAH